MKYMIMYCDICSAKIENAENVERCPRCLCYISDDQKSLVPHGGLIKSISKDQAFMEGMVDLHKNNPVEFYTKIEQFRQIRKQREQSQTVEDNKQKCPTCGSTNIEKISTAKKVTGGFLFGLFSSDVRNTMHCKKCGHKW